MSQLKINPNYPPAGFSAYEPEFYAKVTRYLTKSGKVSSTWLLQIRSGSRKGKLIHESRHKAMYRGYEYAREWIETRRTAKPRRFLNRR